MNIKTEAITVFTVNDLDASAHTFCLKPLENILGYYPFLKRPHRQSFYTLMYIKEATGTIRIDQGESGLQGGNVICTSPNSIISIDINKEARGWILFFTEDFFSLRYNNNALFRFTCLKDHASSQVRLSAEESEQWNFLLNLMAKECKDNLKGAQGILRSSLNILLQELDRKFEPVVNKEPNREGENKVIHFEQLLEQAFRAQKSPSWYAQQLNISTNYLNRICREQRGITSSDIIHKRIIKEARRELHYTSRSVSEIAYELGYESVSYFITFFKRKTGCSPEAFRRSDEGR